MSPSKQQTDVRAAARLAVRRYARDPSDDNARRAQTALRRLRELKSAETARRLQRSGRGVTAGKR